MDRIFISNLGKYNEGELVGGWFELGQDESELERFLKETVQIDAEYEEYFIADTDFEDIDMEVSEYADVFELNTAYQEYENL